MAPYEPLSYLHLMEKDFAVASVIFSLSVSLKLEIG